MQKRQQHWSHLWTRGVGLNVDWMAQHATVASAWEDPQTPIQWRFGCMSLAAERRGLLRLPPIEHPDRVVALAADLAEAAQEFVPTGEARPGAALAQVRVLKPGDPMPWPEIHAVRLAREELRESAHFAAHAAEIALDMASGSGPTPRAWETMERLYFAALTAFSLAGRKAEGAAHLLGVVLRHLPNAPEDPFHSP